jgi:hypothetical protein
VLAGRRNNENPIAHVFRDKPIEGSDDVGDSAVIGGDDSRRSSGSSRADSSSSPSDRKTLPLVAGARQPGPVQVGRPELPGPEDRSLSRRQSQRRCLTRFRRSFLRSSAVSSGNIAASIALSRNAASYCSSPSPWSQVAMSARASPRGHHFRLPYRVYGLVGGINAASTRSLKKLDAFPAPTALACAQLQSVVSGIQPAYQFSLKPSYGPLALRTTVCSGAQGGAARGGCPDDRRPA